MKTIITISIVACASGLIGCGGDDTATQQERGFDPENPVQIAGLADSTPSTTLDKDNPLNIGDDTVDCEIQDAGTGDAGGLPDLDAWVDANPSHGHRKHHKVSCKR